MVKCHIKLAKYQPERVDSLIVYESLTRFKNNSEIDTFWILKCLVTCLRLAQHGLLIKLPYADVIGSLGILKGNLLITQLYLQWHVSTWLYGLAISAVYIANDWFHKYNAILNYLIDERCNNCKIYKCENKDVKNKRI